MALQPGALKLHPTQKVVNVQWGGLGRFVSGDQWGFARYVKIDDKKATQDWKGITNLATASVSSEVLGKSVIGRIDGGSYGLAGGNKDATPPRKGTPTFLLAGGKVQRRDLDIDQPEEAYALIMASHDGEHWSTVFQQITVLTGSTPVRSVQGLVWDKDANGGNGAFFARTFLGSTEECYTSTDGLSWVSGGGDFASHCKGVNDELVGMPDGYYGYDKGKDILIWPDDAGVKVKKKNEGGGYSTAVVTVSELSVFCVAFAGGIWEAGGNAVLDDSTDTAATATSIDDGQTWKIVSKGALGMHPETGQAPSISVIMGAPKSDFS